MSPENAFRALRERRTVSVTGLPPRVAAQRAVEPGTPYNDMIETMDRVMRGRSLDDRVVILDEAVRLAADPTPAEVAEEHEWFGGCFGLSWDAIGTGREPTEESVNRILSGDGLGLLDKMALGAWPGWQNELKAGRLPERSAAVPETYRSNTTAPSLDVYRCVRECSSGQWLALVTGYVLEGGPGCRSRSSLVTD